VTTTPENTAATWRDLADQLTAEQVAQLEDSEKGYRYRAMLPQPQWSTDPRSRRDIDKLLLSRARGHARDNLVAEMIGPVDLPARMAIFDIWQEGDPQPYRVILGKYRTIPGHAARVSTAAIQFADGSIDDGRLEPPNITLYDVQDERLSSDDARELAAVLLEAADELDRLSAGGARCRPTNSMAPEQ
jgi:hypothetical protein